MTDLISGLGLAAFPIVAMVLFLVVFAGVIAHVMRRSQKSEFERAAMLPLSEGEVSGRTKEDAR